MFQGWRGRAQAAAWQPPAAARSRSTAAAAWCAPGLGTTACGEAGGQGRLKAQQQPSWPHSLSSRRACPPPPPTSCAASGSPRASVGPKRRHRCPAPPAGPGSEGGARPRGVAEAEARAALQAAHPSKAGVPQATRPRPVPCRPAGAALTCWTWICSGPELPPLPPPIREELKGSLPGQLAG